MSVSWSITTTTPGRIDSAIGMADGHETAVLAVLAAAQAAIEDACVLKARAIR